MKQILTLEVFQDEATGEFYLDVKRGDGVMSLAPRLSHYSSSEMDTVLEEMRHNMSCALGPYATVPIEERTFWRLGADRMRKIDAIKAVREVTGLGLLESKNLVEGGAFCLRNMTSSQVTRLKDSGLVRVEEAPL